jgi:hypothetical protein
MATKPIKLVCFDVKPEEEKVSKSFNFYKDMTDALGVLKNASDRCRVLSDIADDGEQEFISKVSINNKSVFCTFLHLKPGAAALVQKNLLKKASFSLSDLKESSEENIAGHIIGYTCFLFSDEKLIMKATRNISASELSIYFNWLLKKGLPKYKNRNSIVSIKQRIKQSFDPVSIGSISIGKDVKIKEQETIETVTKSLMKGFVNKLLEDKEIEGLDPENILDATVVLRIKKFSKEEANKNRKVLQSVLGAVKSVDTKIIDRNGRPIKEDEVKETKEVRIHYISEDFPDEDELEMEMRKYLSEV